MMKMKMMTMTTTTMMIKEALHLKRTKLIVLEECRQRSSRLPGSVYRTEQARDRELCTDCASRRSLFGLVINYLAGVKRTQLTLRLQNAPKRVILLSEVETVF